MSNKNLEKIFAKFERMRFQNLLLILFSLSLGSTFAQGFGTIKGKITNTEGYPIRDVQIIISETQKSTFSDSLGNYSITLTAGETQEISFTHISYLAFAKEITVNKEEQKELNIELVSYALKSKMVIIQGQRKDKMTEISIDQKAAENVVTASDDGLGFVKSLASVSSNNELSSAYSVRGGSFDENLIYVNGIQVYRPFLVRAGRQEGLSFVNGDMIKSINFSAGGFDAKYGDKLSSVLDITYKKPDSLIGRVNLSLLGTRLTFGNRHKKFSYLISGRYKSNAYLLGALETDGVYQPRFYDVQTYLNYDISPKWAVGFLGNASLNQFRMIPETRTTRFGGINEAFQLTVDFNGQEISDFQTNFGAFTVDFKPFKNDSTLLKLTASSFQTIESETFDIEGSYRLNELETNFGEDDFGQVAGLLGEGRFLDHSRNFLNATIFNIEHTGYTIWKRGVFRWGAKYQQEEIEDELLEWRNQDSAGYSIPYSSDGELNLEEYLRSENKVTSKRYSGFVQNDWKFLQKHGRSQLYLNTGIRANYWDFSNQLVISPRAALSYTPSSLKTDSIGNTIRDSTTFSYRLASGYYYQPPFYRELRDFQGNINTNIRAQKSIHYVAGLDYDFYAYGRPFTWRSEAYYKDMSDIIPFDVENVRIRYYGENSAKAYAYGIESRINGEFIKGLESWLSVSYMKTEEDIKNDEYYKYYNANGEEVVSGFTLDQTVDDSVRFTRGFMPRTTDQRFSFKIFFQDEMPRFQQLKVHLNLVYNTGLPFGTPGSVAERNTLRLPDYRRVDIGFTYQLVQDGMLYRKTGKVKMPDNHYLRFFKDVGIRFEVFNLLDITNTIGHLWVSDINSREYAVPNSLTQRLVNIRFSASF